MKKIVKMSMIIFIISCGLIFMGKSYKAEAGLNIVLDPGHDSTHSGASGNGVHEEVVNFKIAKYCKEELEKYSGISNVYMTRNGYDCPYPGTSSTEDNKKRVDFAKSVGADIYVSIHNNSSASSSAKGASVYYPNSNYRPDVGKNGERIANIILKKLVEIGLESRGIHVRNSEDNTRYPDGSLADYYGVIKNGKLSGFTSVIIEHAFISNSSDVSKYLSDDTKLKLLGVADAKAIAEYYGLSEKTSWDKNVSAAKLSTSFTSDNMNVTAAVSGLSKAPEVKLAVWSSSNQSDLKWYNAKKNSSGNWVYEIPLKDFKASGVYNVHVYARDGSDIFACSGTFNVSPPTASAMWVENVDFTKGTFDIRITGVTAKSGINDVRAAVWTKDDQSDKKWITASLISDNNYRVKVSMADFFEPAGTFRMHAYATDNIGIDGFLKDTNYNLEFPLGNVSSSIDEGANCFEVSASAISYSSLVEEMKAAVWSSENGQDDVSWYKMTKTDDGWKYDGRLTEHITAEGIDVHVYAFFRNGASVFAGSTKASTAASTVSNEIEAESIQGSRVQWTGKKVSVTANENDFVIKEAENAAVKAKSFADSGISVDTTYVAVEVSDGASNISGNPLETSKEATDVSGASSDTSGASSDISGDAGDNSEINNKISPRDTVKLLETNYAMRDSVNLYSSAKSLISADMKGKDVNFFITDVGFVYDETKYTCERSGELRLQFVLPNQYYNKEIVIYQISADENYTIQKKYDNVILANGYAQISAESEGIFVVAAVTDKVVEGTPAYLHGDLNFDGRVNLFDAKLSLKGSLGIISFTDAQRVAADYNLDGKINLFDSKAILKESLGI